jgi:uncharacterized protein (DUF1800 family)
MSDLKQIKHLFARAGFGLRFEDLHEDRNISVKKAVKRLFKTSENDEPIAVVNDTTDYTMMAKTDEATKKMFMQQQREQDKQLNVDWISKMSTTDAQLREKMTLFWHNHFACRTQRTSFAQQLNNIHRTYALGNFGTMLMEVSKSPAMLQFLNNQQNQKNHPNENFAREVMELFTVGRGNYSEKDIKESARAFTGWSFDKDGAFKLRPFVHDTGDKTFMGQTGNFAGEDIIKILLQKKETAHFISTKLYKYLVNETPDPVHVNAMADVFYNANYEIQPLLEYVFTSEWFYDDKNIGNIIKSPVEFLVGLNRQFYITYQKPEVLMNFQRALGQVLFYPPNVAGWPGGRNWIDNSSLMYRLKIPSTVLNDGVIDFTGKSDPEDESFIAASHRQQQAVHMRVEATPDWDKFLKSIPDNLPKTDIAQFMLEPKMNNTLINTANQSADIRTLAIDMVSTPEYQLC